MKHDYCFQQVTNNRRITAQSAQSWYYCKYHSELSNVLLVVCFLNLLCILKMITLQLQSQTKSNIDREEEGLG